MLFVNAHNAARAGLVCACVASAVWALTLPLSDSTAGLNVPVVRALSTTPIRPSTGCGTYLSCRSFPFAGVDAASGDGQNSMDERDLDLAVPLGAPLDERQGGQGPFGVGEVLSPAAMGGCGVLCMGRPPESVKAPGLGVACPPGAAF